MLKVNFGSRRLSPPEAPQTEQKQDNSVFLLSGGPELYSKLEQEAQRRGMTVAQLLAAALDMYLKAKPVPGK